MEQFEEYTISMTERYLGFNGDNKYIKEARIKNQIRNKEIFGE